MPDAQPLLDIIELAFRELALFAGFGFLVGALDTLAIDLLWCWHMIGSLTDQKGMRCKRLEDLSPPERPGRHAIFVPTWDEAEVIGPMLETTVWRFAGQDYRLFIGHYPNDPTTTAKIESVTRRAANIRMVCCPNGIM